MPFQEACIPLGIAPQRNRANKETPMTTHHRQSAFFNASLESRDAAIFGAIRSELGRQRDEI
ncbi:MAG: hypothetical protein EB086_06230, partial [Rhodobacteraceae bacterium]|nr:hypothetical protein [Paracoccaceae bacterium]